MPCMPHFHDHFIPSTWVVLQTPEERAAAATPAGPQPCCQQTEIKLRAEFREVMRIVMNTLQPFREAYDAVRRVIAEKAEEERQAKLNQPEVPLPH